MKMKKTIESVAWTLVKKRISGAKFNENALTENNALNDRIMKEMYQNY